MANQFGWFEPPVNNVDIDKFIVAQDEPVAPEVTHRPLAELLNVDEADMVEVGGVKRPKRDLDDNVVNLDAERSRYLASLPKTGRAPVIPKDANPTVAKLSKELSENPGTHPSKSPLIAAEPFDRAAYTKDPQGYLQLTRPGRVFQSLKPEAKVVPLKSLTPVYQEVLQGETVVMRVEAEPKMPVTFHTQQLGEFENRLKTITVAANEDGIAKVTYRAVTGVRGLVHVLAASPVHSQRVDFTVNVSLPE